MKRLLFFLFAGLLGTLNVFSGEPVPGAEIYIEQEPIKEPIAFQLTGNDGAVTFAHLNKGIYALYVSLPEQKGKLMRDRAKIDCDLKAGYVADKKEYFLQETKGFFILKLDDLKKVKQFIPQYESQPRRGNVRIFIGEVEIESDGGQITLGTEALAPKEFEKSVQKAKHDVAMNAIRNMK